MYARIYIYFCLAPPACQRLSAPSSCRGVQGASGSFCLYRHSSSVLHFVAVCCSVLQRLERHSLSLYRHDGSWQRKGH